MGGELGWVAGDKDHAGKGLGAAVCNRAVQRFLSAGYRRIYLQTDDVRLAAVKVYLKMGFVPYLFAWDISVPARRINEIVHGKRSITADTALRLGRYFGTTAQFWMNLQDHFALEVQTDKIGDQLDEEVRTLAVA